MTETIHGVTSTLYQKGCRCDPCKAANAAAHRAWLANPNRFITHGMSGYSRLCRCDICTIAHREYMREYMRKRRAKLAVTAGGDHGEDQEAAG